MPHILFILFYNDVRRNVEIKDPVQFLSIDYVDKETEVEFQWQLH